ncbi:MAG: MFS transporter [Acetobacteraceae bacterium]|nr:MFS transporter [Acetobacteraceae bacterium]
MKLLSRGTLVLLAGQFLVMAGFGILLPILPFFAKGLGASSLEMGLTVSLFAFFQFLFSPVWGAISDRVGRRPVIALGLGGFAVPLALIGISRTMRGVLIARALGGLLSGSGFATGQAYMADITPDRDRTAAMGAMGGAANLGFIFGPMIGGVLAPLGMRTTFLIAGGMVLAVSVATWFLLPQAKPRGQAGPAPLRAREVWDALKSPHALFFWLALTLAYGGSGLFSMQSYYMIDRIGASPAQVSLLFMGVGTTSALLQGLAVGRLVRRLGDDRVIAGGLVAGIVGFAALIAATHLGGMVAGSVLVSAALALVRPTITGALSRRTALPQGLTMGLQSSFDSFERMIGPLLAGMLYSAWIFGPYLASALVYLGSLAAVAAVAARQRAAEGGDPL